MTVRAMCVGLLVAAVSSAGCGTVANLARSRPGSGGKAPFGGVRQDVWCLRAAASGEPVFRSHPAWASRHYPRAVLLLCCAADVPLSFAADVATWPYTAAYTYINQPIPVPPIIVTGPPAPPPAPDSLVAQPPPEPAPVPPETLPPMTPMTQPPMMLPAPTTPMAQPPTAQPPMALPPTAQPPTPQPPTTLPPTEGQPKSAP